MVYEGKEKYIFVSYAHNDADKVLPMVRALAEDGYRVWYDSGIEAGTEWPEYIEEHLINSHVVLVFMSPSSVESRNCRNEINFALELKKEILVIYLEETTLLKGMRLQLNSTQSLFRQHHKSDESFTRELLHARILADCRAIEGEHLTPMEAPAPQKAKTPTAKTAKKWPLYALLAAILIAVVACVCFFAFGGGDGASPEDSESQPVEMSENLYDYTVEIEGVVYQFPCRYEDFTSNGWTISSSGYSDTAMIKGDDYESLSMSNNGKHLNVIFYNLSGNAKAVKDCPVGGISYSVGDGVEVKLAKGITAKSTVDEIIAAFGSPNSQNDEEEYVSLNYEEEAYGSSFFRFMIYKKAENQLYTSVLIENRIETGDEKTETNAEKPKYLDAYKAPTAFDINLPIVKLEGDLYQLPAPISSFLDNGWKIVDKPGFVKSGNSEMIAIERDGAKVYAWAFNYADYQTTPENCAIQRIQLDAEENVDLELSNGLKLGLTKAQVEAIVTDGYEYYEGTYIDNWSYYGGEECEYYINVYADKETKKVSSLSISCDTWNY